MTERPLRLADQYVAVLEDYLARGDEVVRQRAYELGRQALTEGLGVVDMAALHHDALARLVRRSHRDVPGTVRTAAGLFMESLSPFEMTHRGFHESTLALRRLNQTLEEEVKRIAHALHDDAGQLLASLHLALEDLAREQPPSSAARLEKVRQLLALLEEHLRRFSHELRPTVLDDLGLQPAIETLAAGIARRTGLAVTLDGALPSRLPQAIETALYRVVVEALSNVTRHARAGRVQIRLRAEDRLVRVDVKDNGVGFDRAAGAGRRGEGGLGLIGMRERLQALGGMMEVLSAPGHGTEVRIVIPLEE